MDFFSHTFRSNEDCGQISYRTNLKRVSKENLGHLLAASISLENPSTFDRFIVKKLSLRFFRTPFIYICENNRIQYNSNKILDCFSFFFLIGALKILTFFTYYRPT